MTTINGQAVTPMTLQEKEAHTTTNVLAVEVDDQTLILKIKMDEGGWPTKGGHRGVALLNRFVNFEVDGKKIGLMLTVFEHKEE